MPTTFNMAGVYAKSEMAIETVATIPSQVQSIRLDDDDDGRERQQSSRKLGSSDADEHDMRVLGKAQQLQRNFRFISTLGFSCTLMSTWEIALMTSTFALINGGTAGLIWGYLAVWIGYLMVFASIAELSSIAPTSGGQYHWVSEFAPPGSQRFISYIVGWVSVLGWQVGLASLAYLAGTMIQGLVVLNDPTYEFQAWHGTLLVIAITAFCIVFNTFLAKRLPFVESMVLIIHVLGFFAVLLPLWMLAPRADATTVFTEFLNLGGWETQGLAVMVGILSPVYTLIGADSPVHMSEEIKDASIVLPRAIMWSAAFNGSLGFAMVITFCFTLGNVVDVIHTPTGYPFIQVFYNVTQSYVGTSVMTAILIVNITSATISTVATVSRQTWSFARDRGLPFSDFISHVNPDWNIPLNAVLVTFVTTCLLSLINIGSTVAFNAIGSLAVSALLGTYIISFTCLILRRFRGPLPPSRWSMGKLGLPCNIGALAFLITVWVFIFFPISPLPFMTLETMNWNALIFGVVIIFSVVYYLVLGRKTYTAPVEMVERDWSY